MGMLQKTSAVVIAVLTSAVSPSQAQDAEMGQQVFKKCRVCHMIGDNAKNRVGPSLDNIVGRRAAAAEKFNYSPAMKSAASNGLIWTESALDDYLTNPRKMVSGTRMAFGGIASPEDRKNLIAYLKSASSTK